jgi:putative phage-type endonuclease
MIQNSPEWYEWRRGGVGSSEVPAIMGVCPYHTAYEVWLDKTGRTKGFDRESFAQRHGKETEEKARARYELVNMIDMRRDVCMVHPEYPYCRASLDGENSEERVILELKCPIGRDVINMAKTGTVAEHYLPQVQWQLLVSGADRCDFFVYHEESGEHETVAVYPDFEYQAKLLIAVQDFWKLVQSDTPPPLTDRDIKLIPEDDSKIAPLCLLIKSGKDSLPKEEINKLKAEVVALAGHPKMRCGDVQVSTVNRKGVFSYYKLTIRQGAAS